MKIAAGQFKATCLKLMDQVQQTHEDIEITKHGKPVAKLVALEDEGTPPLFGYLKDEMVITGDIVQPTGERWNAEAS